MSRLSNIVEKPYEKTIQYKNEVFNKRTKEVEREAGWYYYEKSSVEGEKGKNIKIDMPFTFCWLLSAQSFSGYNEAAGESVYSNEILSEKDMKEFGIKGNRILTAKIGKEEIATGTYEAIKDVVGTKGGKYCQPVYALAAFGKEYEIVRILIKGSCLDGWFGTHKEAKSAKYAIISNGHKDYVKGTNEYTGPTFEYDEDTSPEFIQKADEAAKTVIDYFKFILNTDSSTIVEEETGEKLPF